MKGTEIIKVYKAVTFPLKEKTFPKKLPESFFPFQTQPGHCGIPGDVPTERERGSHPSSCTQQIPLLPHHQCGAELPKGLFTGYHWN